MMSDPVVLALVAGAVRLVVSVVLYRMRSTGGSQARGQVTVVRVRAGEGTLIVCLHESPASGLRQRDER
ncbi:hypothetical protein [Streptosporangium saharense]|uniref:hypothetical protein n=1 Tax=Streptosporangium saharense TaxID=1706840 RepID=UPI0033214A32